MKEDIKLKKICLKMAIVSTIVLLIVLCLYIPFNESYIIVDNKIVKLNVVANVFLNFIIWISAGIATCSFTIWLTKRFDYSSKKKDLLKDFYYVSVELRTIFWNLRPLFKTQDNEYAIKNYKDYNDKTYLLNELKNIYSKICFNTGEENEAKIVRNIYSFFDEKSRIASYIASIIAISQESKIDLSALIPTIKNHEHDLFDIKEKDGYIDYYALVEVNVFPEIKKLENILDIPSSLEEMDPIRERIHSELNV